MSENERRARKVIEWVEEQEDDWRVARWSSPQSKSQESDLCAVNLHSENVKQWKKRIATCGPVGLEQLLEAIKVTRTWILRSEHENCSEIKSVKCKKLICIFVFMTFWCATYSWTNIQERREDQFACCFIDKLKAFTQTPSGVCCGKLPIKRVSSRSAKKSIDVSVSGSWTWKVNWNQKGNLMWRNQQVNGEHAKKTGKPMTVNLAKQWKTRNMRNRSSSIRDFSDCFSFRFFSSPSPSPSRCLHLVLFSFEFEWHNRSQTWFLNFFKKIVGMQMKTRAKG